MRHVLGSLLMASVALAACGARSDLDVTVLSLAPDAAVAHHPDAVPPVDAHVLDAPAPDAPVMMLPEASAPDAPSTAPHVASLALGWHQACALLSDGTARCWGDNNSGQLATPPTDAMMTQSSVAVPVPVPGPIVALAGGYVNGLAVLADGSLYCWGAHSESDCTGPDVSAVESPTLIGSGYAAVSAGLWYACATHVDATVSCWGLNDSGQLGNLAEAGMSEPAPTTVPGVQGVVSVATSQFVTCALVTGGGVLCWGEGPLGDASGQSSARPVQVQLPEPATAVAVSSRSACALVASDEVMCWGDGPNGQLGLGAGTTSSNLPALVPLPAPAKAISSGQNHACALLSSGQVACWGDEGVSQAGNFTPVLVPGLTSAVAIASGAIFDCAILASGAVVCWGDNQFGDLGDGTTVSSATPVQVMGLP